MRRNWDIFVQFSVALNNITLTPSSLPIKFPPPPHLVVLSSPLFSSMVPHDRLKRATACYTSSLDRERCCICGKDYFWAEKSAFRLIAVPLAFSALTTVPLIKAEPWFHLKATFSHALGALFSTAHEQLFSPMVKKYLCWHCLRISVKCRFYQCDEFSVTFLLPAFQKCYRTTVLKR